MSTISTGFKHPGDHLYHPTTFGKKDQQSDSGHENVILFGEDCEGGQLA